MTQTLLCLLTRDDYSGVLGWAEYIVPDKNSRQGCPRLTAYGTDGQVLFSLSGPENTRHAQQHAGQLGMRLVVGDYFGVTAWRPESESAPAYARRVYADLLLKT